MLRIEDVETVKAQVNMVMVAEYFGLILNRKSFALCPFHPDKNPSMQIFAGYLNNDGYYCRACGAGGTIFTFVMEYTNQPFEESVRMIADVFGIAVTDTNSTPTKQDKRKISHCKALRKAESLQYDCRVERLCELSERIQLYEEIMKTSEPFSALFVRIGHQLPIAKGEWDHEFELMCNAKKRG